MKLIATIFILFCFAQVQATNPYRAYLLAKALSYHPTTTRAIQPAAQKPVATIPQYQIPKGSVFCRMEDKLTKATGIWIKVGVK